MKLGRLRQILIILFVALIFIFLGWNTHLIDEQKSNYFTTNLRYLKELDADVKVDVFKLRYGLLTYYDPIVEKLTKLKELQNELKNSSRFVKHKEQSEIQRLLEKIAKIQQREEMLVEKFKSQNAILRNSLSYLPVLVAEIAEKADLKQQNLQLVTLLNTLLRQVLIYNLNASNELSPKINAQIKELLKSKNEPSLAGMTEDIKLVTVHAQVILNSKPEVDTLLEELVSLPTAQHAEKLYRVYIKYYRQYMDKANLYRLLLFLFTLILIVSIAAYSINKLKRLNQAMHQAELALRAEQEKSEHLLLNILPISIKERLKLNPGPIADSFEEVTVMFADIVGFTQLSERISAKELVDILNHVFSAFDQLAQKHGLEKIKTIGDAYMAVAGVPAPREDHAEAIAQMALDMQQEVSRFAALTGQKLSIRIGINTGPVVAGVIGINKFSYDLWGDTVNTASRMESHGEAGAIQLTESTYQRLRNKFLFEKRGAIQVKGKGQMVTYWLRGKFVTDKFRPFG